MPGLRRIESMSRSPHLPSTRVLGVALALCGSALFAPACGDAGSGSGGSAGHGAGGNTTTTSSNTAGNAGSGAGGTTGSGGTTGGTNTGGGAGTTSSGGANTGGTGAGGVTGSGGNTGGNGTGGVAGSGMGGVAGSGGVSGGGAGGGVVGQPDNWGAPPLVMMPPLPPQPDLSGYPLDAEGRPILLSGATFNVVAVTTPDAMTARDACAALVSNCYSPGVRSMDACMMSAPTCLTTTPWNEATPCCAQACLDGYAALRTAKVDPLNSYLKVLYDGPVCMPGVDTMLAGGAP